MARKDSPESAVGETPIDNQEAQVQVVSDSQLINLKLDKILELLQKQ